MTAGTAGAVPALEGTYEDAGRTLRPAFQVFIDAVAAGRGLDRDRVAKIADGRIFTGAQALANGLVDSLGGLADAIDLGAQMAGIEGKPEVLYMERRDLSLWRAVMGEGAASSITDLVSGMRLMYITTNPYR